ncbi:MAG: hypothetical protein ACOYOQ_14190 [Microthrixaceae bacterium]
MRFGIGRWTVLWQAFPAKLVMGVGVAAIGLRYLVMALTDPGPAGPKVVFGLVFALVSYLGLRLLAAGFVLTERWVIAVGMLRTVRVPRAVVTGAEPGEHGANGRLVLSTGTGDAVDVPLVLSGSYRQRRSTAAALSAALRGVDTGSGPGVEPEVGFPDPGGERPPGRAR